MAQDHREKDKFSAEAAPHGIEGSPEGFGAAALVGEVVGIHGGLLLTTVATVGDALANPGFVEEGASSDTGGGRSSQSLASGALLVGMPIPMARETPGVSQEIHVENEGLTCGVLRLAPTSVGQGSPTRIDVDGGQTDSKRPASMSVVDGGDVHEGEDFKNEINKVNFNFGVYVFITEISDITHTHIRS